MTFTVQGTLADESWVYQAGFASLTDADAFVGGLGPIGYIEVMHTEPDPDDEGHILTITDRTYP